jgi:hypothetical protein
MGGASRGYEFDWGALYAHMEVSRWTPLHNWCMLIKQKINTLKKKKTDYSCPGHSQWRGSMYCLDISVRLLILVQTHLDHLHMLFQNNYLHSQVGTIGSPQNDLP